LGMMIFQTVFETQTMDMFSKACIDRNIIEFKFSRTCHNIDLSVSKIPISQRMVWTTEFIIIPKSCSWVIPGIPHGNCALITSAREIHHITEEDYIRHIQRLANVKGIDVCPSCVQQLLQKYKFQTLDVNQIRCKSRIDPEPDANHHFFVFANFTPNDFVVKLLLYHPASGRFQSSTRRANTQEDFNFAGLDSHMLGPFMETEMVRKWILELLKSCNGNNQSHIGVFAANDQSLTDLISLFPDANVQFVRCATHVPLNNLELPEQVSVMWPLHMPNIHATATTVTNPDIFEFTEEKGNPDANYNNWTFREMINCCSWHGG